MRDSFKGCSKTKENEDGNESGVSCNQVISDFYQGCFCAEEVITNKVFWTCEVPIFFKDFGKAEYYRLKVI